MPRKPRTTRTVFSLSPGAGASVSREELEAEKTKYERQIASDFAKAISDRLKRRIALLDAPLSEADDRDAILSDDSGNRYGIQLVEVRDVNRQMRLADNAEPTSPKVDSGALSDQLLRVVEKKVRHYAPAVRGELWLVIHTTDYPTSVLMMMSGPAREWLANSDCPFSTIWVHSTTQPGAGCFEQLWPPGSESDFVRSFLEKPADPKHIDQHLWRGEQIMAFFTVRMIRPRTTPAKNAPKPE